MKNLNFILLVLVFVSFSCGDKKVERQDTEKTTQIEQTRCENCGMFTKNFPEWEEIVVKQDSTEWYFCGPRCMFKFLLQEPQRMAILKEIKVKDYYDLKYVDGKKAWYVIGSDVLGPMGNELIPFGTEQAAAEFLKDHAGEKIIKFEDVDLQLIKKIAQKMEME